MGPRTQKRVLRWSAKKVRIKKKQKKRYAFLGLSKLKCALKMLRCALFFKVNLRSPKFGSYSFCFLKMDVKYYFL